MKVIFKDHEVVFITAKIENLLGIEIEAYKQNHLILVKKLVIT